MARIIQKPHQSGSFSGFVHRFSYIVERLSRWGLAISAVMLTAMMFLTFFDVIGAQLGKWTVINNRTAFFRPIIGGQELMELMMLLMISFGLAYCALKKSHIRVDLIMQYVSPRVNLGFDLLAYGAAFTFSVFLTWQAIQFGLDNIRDGAVSTVLMIPLYPFNFLLAVGAAVLALVFLSDFLKSIVEVRT